MTTITVSVDATWRLARVEIAMPRDMPGNVIGYTEVMLTEPATPSEGANVLRSGLPFADPKTYGVMPGATVARPLDTVLDETVEVEGLTLSMTNVMDALKEFTRRWRVEDVAKPPATMIAPTAAEPTEFMAVRDPIVTVPVPPPPPAQPKV
jgi:hypothetical protein